MTSIIPKVPLAPQATSNPMQGMLKLTTARRMARLKLPYFTTLFESLAPVEAPGLRTFGVTEHLVLLYDPQTLEEWPLKKVAFVIAHEGFHIFHKHAARAKRLNIPRGGSKAQLWNLCGDAYINRVLKTVWNDWAPEDAILPESLKLPPEMENATTEEAYFYLLKQEQEDDEDEGGDDGDEEGEGDEGDTMNGRCGSGAGHKHRIEVDAAHPASRTQAEVEVVIKQTALRIQEAQRDKTAGRVPDSLLRDAQRLLQPPKVPWNKTLQRAVRFSAARKIGAVDYGYHGLARRQGALSVTLGSHAPILPKLFAPQLQVDIVIDTSGSMDQKELGIAAREAKGILRSLGAEITFTAIDAKVHEQKQVNNIEALIKLLKGGGGTSFVPYFDTLATRPRHKRPQVIVFMTDGYGPAPAQAPPGADTIWVLIGKNAPRPTNWQTGEHIDWGTFIQVED